MPTVVLLDRSLSMRRHVSPDDSEETRHSLACKGLEWFFQHMQLCFPLEFTCLMAFSSSCEVMVPFTRDYGELKSKLGDVSVQDRTDVHNALVVMVDVFMSEWGGFAPCRVLLVTDGAPGVRHQDTAASHRNLLSIPFSCEMHVLCVAAQQELSNPLSALKLQRLCDATGISMSEVHTPKTPLVWDSVQECFKDLVNSSFQPYHGLLKCGTLQSPITLSPPPTTRPRVGVLSSCSASDIEESIRYPSELTVCGFLDASSLPVPPLLARHFVLDPVSVPVDPRTGSSPTGAASVGSGSYSSNGTAAKAENEESKKPSYRVLLHGSLKCESKVALIQLSDTWFGIMFSATSGTKKSNLILGVFYPEADISWLGPFSYLGPKPMSIDPRISTASEKDPFPLSPPRNPSFQTPANLLWATDSVLQSDVTKVIRYSRKLPDKEGALVKELNKLRMVALTYSIPELLELLCSILGKEEAAATHLPNKALLQQCQMFLASNKNPQEKLAIARNKN